MTGSAGFDFSIEAVAAFKEAQLAARAADLEPLFEKLRTWDNMNVGNNIVGITFKKLPLTPDEEVHTMSFTEEDDGSFSWASSLYPHAAAGFFRTGALDGCQEAVRKLPASCQKSC